MPRNFSDACPYVPTANLTNLMISACCGTAARACRRPAARARYCCTVFFAAWLLGQPQGLRHAVLAAVGFATGYLVVAMGDGGRKAAGALPLSPVKWSKKRGF